MCSLSVKINFLNTCLLQHLNCLSTIGDKVIDNAVLFNVRSDLRTSLYNFAIQQTKASLFDLIINIRSLYQNALAFRPREITLALTRTSWWRIRDVSCTQTGLDSVETYPLRPMMHNYNRGYQIRAYDA